MRTPWALGLVLLTSPALAAAECPPGDWFCESPESPSEPSAPEPAEAAPAPPPLEPAPERPRLLPLREEHPAPRARGRRRHREWGAGFHLGFGIVGNDEARDEDASMNGFGVALRYRPWPHVAFEGSSELLWGTDYNGFERVEYGFLASAMLFFNPRSAFQVYTLGGFGLGAAWVHRRFIAVVPEASDDRDVYGYAGGHLGLGLEGRVTRHLGVGGDVIGFIRDRIDGDAAERPEFIDRQRGRTSNTSAGGLVRFGLVYYFW